MINYLTINILIIIVPLVFSFDKNLKFRKYFYAYLFSMLIVGIPFLIWDYIATLNGDWAFNPEYLTEIYLFILPLEEVLFFVTVPYSILFIYETINFYIKDKNILDLKISNRANEVLILLFIILGINFHERNYTVTVMFFISAFFILERLNYRKLFPTKNYLLTILISFIPFILVNYLLTSLPIVTYNDNENLGIRFTTIPVDDFFYSFAMISLWIYFYNYFKNKFLIKVS